MLYPETVWSPFRSLRRPSGDGHALLFLRRVFSLRAAAVALGYVALLSIASLPALAASRRLADTVPQCSPRIKMTASYLAPVTAAQGPGFFFRIENGTSRPITLVAPVPSSAHWYAHVGRLWLWRASAGRGGALVNAISPRGPMFVYRAQQPAGDPPETITVPPHGAHEWAEWTSQDPAIAYDPSCAHCNYPGEHEFRAVFAYAWLPAPGEQIPHLLTCGLRSNQVIMPPFDPSRPAARR